MMYLIAQFVIMDNLKTAKNVHKDLIFIKTHRNLIIASQFVQLINVIFVKLETQKNVLIALTH